MLFASIFLSLDLREVLTLDLYHRVVFAKTSKPLQPHVSYLYYILLARHGGFAGNRVTTPMVRFGEWGRVRSGELGPELVEEWAWELALVWEQASVRG